MPKRLLVSISADQATVGVARNGKLEPCQVFRHDAQGVEGFDRYLAQMRNVRVDVLVDVVEEDYRFEMLPHASGRDRTELIERRLRQLYRNTAYCTALAQGRDTGKRRDDQYLFMGLTNPDLLEGWLARIEARSLPVAGVYLLPLLAEPLVQRLAPDTPNLLLVSQHPAGLRLTFLRHGKLRVSRLTRVENVDGSSRVTAYTEEIANTRLYLHALRVMSLDEHLSVIALDREGTLSGLEQSVAREISNAEAVLLRTAQIAQRTGVPEAIVRDIPDALYLHYLASQSARGNLAPEPVTEQFQIYQMRRALYATAAAAGVVSLAWLAMNGYQYFELKSEYAHAVAQTGEYQRRYQEVTRHFPAAPTSADNLVAAVQTAERLKTVKKNPEAAMQAVGRTLEQFPNVYLKTFGWKYGTRDFEADGLTRRTESAPSAPTTGQTRRQSAFIEGEIRPFSGDYRAALDTISNFAEALKQDPTVVDVKVVALPLNVSPTMALSGSTAESTSRATNAPFRLNVAFKPTL